MRHSLAASFVLLLLCSSASAQTPVACVPTTTAVPLSPGQSILTFTQPDFTTKDAAGADIVTGFRGEVLQSGSTVVTNWSIAKANATPVTGTGVPANCYQTTIPALAPLLPTSNYTIRLVTIGPGGSATSSTTSNPFFLRGAPQGSGNLVVITPGS